MRQRIEDEPGSDGDAPCNVGDGPSVGCVSRPPRAHADFNTLKRHLLVLVARMQYDALSASAQVLTDSTCVLKHAAVAGGLEQMNLG